MRPQPQDGFSLEIRRSVYEIYGTQMQETRRVMHLLREQNVPEIVLFSVSYFQCDTVGVCWSELECVAMCLA